MEHKLNAGIIGLGLIGGSMGLALRELGGFGCIAGFDNNPLHSQQALSLGLVDECISLEELISDGDVLFLATPVESIIALLPKLTSIKPSATIIDLGGTKELIIKHIPDSIRKNFIAAHPMAGTEFYGPKAALPHLFKDSIVILTNLEESGEAQIQMAREIFLGIGMKIIKMDAHEHDRHIALISHMPHIISYALANAVLSQEDPQTILALIGGGFRSMSRLSKSSPKMWNDIFKQNTQNVLDSITSFQDELQKAKNMLESKDWEGLEAFMAQANKLQEFM
ncbi:prephenate dehydrogenase [uncultured Helicobacter sp.]|uniref:prephenate dehydrogenase n=1 Tax=uncultured Helicobacter sp. TaxID=175537 RepID=UPI00374FA06B